MYSGESIGIVSWGKEEMIYTEVVSEKQSSSRVWTQAMICGQIGPWPEMVQVEVAESSSKQVMLYLLDSCGRLYVLNPNLATTDPSSHQLIFTFRSLGAST